MKVSRVNSLGEIKLESGSKQKSAISAISQSILDKKGMLNFESKLDKDLKDTTTSLINHMKNHSLLSK